MIGHQSNLLHDSQIFLKMFDSKRDEVKGRSAWDRYGVTGWGVSDTGCGHGTYSFFEENTSIHNLGTGSHLLEYYTAETEKLVEDEWAVEWQQEGVKFPKIKFVKN